MDDGQDKVEVVIKGEKKDGGTWKVEKKLWKRRIRRVEGGDED